MLLHQLSLILFIECLVQAASFRRQQSLTTYTLPIGASKTQARADAIAATRLNFTYGPDIAGNGPFYPTGSVAEAMIAQMSNELFTEQAAWTAEVNADASAAAHAVVVGGGLNTFDDYTKLYDGNWLVTLPNGVDKGQLSNGTSDLLFSMERLSDQPYSVRRLSASEALSFVVDNSTAMNLTTMTQTALQATGRLFYVDYRSLADQPLVEGRYAAACDAYFFIHPISGDFLPLAIRPNNGSPLVYTPLDGAEDWQLAKLLFNQNDVWWGQWYHLVATHEVIDLVYEAAWPIKHLLSESSPSPRLVNVGGAVDALFSWGGSTAASFSDSLYYGGAGKWQSNYLARHVGGRGLVNSKFGPPLKSFPFYSDASVITDAIRAFMTTFVNSYYTSPATLSEDQELQNFIAEAIPAQIFDFPTSLTKTSDLVDILTHFAYLVSVLHGVMNTNEIGRASMALPFHPVGLYAPLPQVKGVTDLMPFMPNLTQSIGQIVLTGTFGRPFFVGGNRTLSEMFGRCDLDEWHEWSDQGGSWSIQGGDASIQQGRQWTNF
ncbi:lipoxygenase [Mycena floridula]|nr:lipoxygenase [Mycena floridula]